MYHMVVSQHFQCQRCSLNLHCPRCNWQSWRSYLQVTIWNTGEPGDTYRPEMYGPFITIHKTLGITAKGNASSSMKVLNARGEKTDITKADDLQRMLRYLSVNAANPSIVLTQDHARGLLSADKASNKLYELMMDSLGFEMTLELLNAAKANIHNQRLDVCFSPR
jgi:hypothetical protein